jgi:hypothetical protein
MLSEMVNRITRQGFAIGMVICAIATQADGAKITVTNTNDSGSGSLRQALSDANDGDTINFAVTGTITLTSGALLVTKNLTITGPGAHQLSIDGNQALLVFGIVPGKTAVISGLTVRNGQIGIWNEGISTTVSNCVLTANSSLGILTGDGVLTVNNCTISGNSEGGLDNDHATLNVNNCAITGNSPFGIYNNQVLSPPPPGQRSHGRPEHRKSDNAASGLEASLAIANSIISGNSGPGVDNNSGVATITTSTISDNSNDNSGAESGEGGGIYSHSGKLPDILTVTDCTISGNFAFFNGGGIAAGFSLTILNSTVSGNTTGDPNYGFGGGISAGSVTIMNCTITGNSATYSGGGISTSGGTIANTILGNHLGGNIGGGITSQGYNLCSDDGGGLLNGPGDQINTDPLLGPLQPNGGPTLTHLPLSGSPAIDAGDPNFTPPPLRDQRGICFHRVFGRRIDIGSVEIQPEPRCPTPVPRPTP